MIWGARDHEERPRSAHQLPLQPPVPNTPVEVCLHCGMVYCDAAVLKEIERCFFAIQDKSVYRDADQIILKTDVTQCPTRRHLTGS